MNQRLAFYEINAVNEYEPDEILGKGAFGMVIKAKSKSTDKNLALKLFSKGKVKVFLEKENEAEVLSKLSHVNLVPSYGMREFPSFYCIILKYVDGGTLEDRIRYAPIHESLAANITSQILRGLKYLHDNKYIHRDIKPSNILLETNETVKISDLGSAKLLNSRAERAALTSIRGTILYMAPEVAQRKVYDEKCDIWSVGCTVHEMLTKKTPSELENVPRNIIDIFLWARDVDETIRIDTQISDHVKQFLGSCLEINTEKRPSCQKLLKHEWFEEQESFQKWKVLQSGLPEWSDCKQKLDDLIEEETERSSCCVRTVTKKKKSAVICFTLLLLATAAVAICVIMKPWEQPKEQSTEKKNLTMTSEPPHIVKEPHDVPIQKDDEQPENLNKDEKEENGDSKIIQMRKNIRPHLRTKKRAQMYQHGNH